MFGNEIQTEKGKAGVKNVTLQRVYKDKDGNFQHTTSFKANDIPKAVLALSKAYDYLVSEEKKE